MVKNSIKTFLEFCKFRGLQSNLVSSLDLYTQNTVYYERYSGSFYIDDDSGFESSYSLKNGYYINKYDNSVLEVLEWQWLKF